MKLLLDAMAWILVAIVVAIVLGAFGWGLWEVAKWFFGEGVWKLVLGLFAYFMVIRSLRWAFCRVTKEPVPFWSNMGFFE